MRLFGRNDLALLAALSVALFIMFSRPLGDVLEYAREMEQSTGLQLLPGLVILVTVFLFQQLRQRQEVQADALLAAAAAKTATDRAAEMERLVGFGQALARSLDEKSIRDVVAAHIPLLLPGRGAWAMVRESVPDPEHGEALVWQTLTVVGDSSSESRERAARRALGELDPSVGATEDDVCFPMIIAGRPVGVIGVSAVPPLSEQARSVLAAAGALLAVSLKNAELFREVRENSVRDPLTGCYRRAHALEVLENELRRARRSQLPVSTIMFDVDHFKSINDTYGHLAGDAVLVAIGTRMRAVLRGSDLKCRYGGEEFLIVLPDTPPNGAQRVADSLRRDIESHPVKWGQGEICVTASFGVAANVSGEVDAIAVVGRADAALYTAKQSGRNCVRQADIPELLSAEQSTPSL
jgi:diguanylate cyclase (GGDEF)-like protein